MRKLLVTGVTAFAALAGWATPSGAGIFSTTGPVIAIVAGDLFVGEAEGNVVGSGTIRIQSRAKPEVTCRGQFTYSAEIGDTGNMQCSDGATATFDFQRLSLVRGYGTGSSSRGAMSFTYGLTANESVPYLKLPPGKSLRMSGKDLMLVDVRSPGSGLLLAAPSNSRSEAAPDVLLRAATFAVTSRLKQERNLQAISPETFAQLVESEILPLFDFRHMTRLAVARNWRLASPEQQTALIAEFRTLLVRSYSAALANYHGQTVEYKAPRVAPGDTAVTVRSSVKQARADRLRIDYDMEKTTAGWKVYDIKIAGVSVIATYQSTFARTMREVGVDGLIASLGDKNRQADSGVGSDESAARPWLFMYAVISSAFGGGR
jgi:phospholipid transport system substrate-binding protein